MFSKRCDVAIINRTFWPENKIIGEALLQLAELSSDGNKVCVITQSEGDIENSLIKESRGQDIVVSACKARSDSTTHLVWRMIDALVFMFWTLLILMLKRPKRVYVATDPPVVVPFIVFIYAKLSRAKYVYHLQDIHPEAANIIIPLNRYLFKALQRLDSVVMRHAESIITLTETMKHEIVNRSSTNSEIYLVDNPTVMPDGKNVIEKKAGFVFCGNAGRLQRIPLLLQSIKLYHQNGGELPFVFAGGGLYSNDIQALADKSDKVTYLGVIPPEDAAELIAGYQWALLPINDEVTKYAFPSKTSSYVVSGTSILSICSNDTSVAKWVVENEFGVNALANEAELVQTYFSIEKKTIQVAILNNESMKKNLGIPIFVKKLNEIIFRL